MRSSTLRMVSAGVTLLLSAITLSAQAGSTNVPNWTVPPYRAQSSSGGIQTMVDISDAAIFVAVTTCRVFDTRDPVGPYGGPRLVGNAPRNFDIDSGPCTGIPPGSAAFSMNFGAILPDGDGFITIWPAGAAQPTSSFMNILFGEVVANAAIVPASSGGSISVFPNVGTHLYGDINGYFMDSGGNLNNNVTLYVDGSDPTEPTIYGLNRDTTSTSPSVNGVRGYINTTQNNPSGVYGLSDGASGINFGVTGQGDSGTNGAAGVYGLGGSGSFTGTTAYPAAGVRAVGRDANGINAFASGSHSAGSFHTFSGATQVADVYIGWNEFATFGIYVQEGNVLLSDDLSVSGAKDFVQPHPTDPSKQVRYVSLESPKSEVFFRGTAQIERGVSRIEIPEEFRVVARPGTYSAMITPVGAMATVAVMAEGADGIVVQASRNVKINYVVYAIRDGFENRGGIEENTLFQPRYEGLYTQHQNDHVMRLMRQNGTIRPDGTVNMELAARHGWTLKPEAENPRKPAPAPSE